MNYMLKILILGLAISLPVYSVDAARKAQAAQPQNSKLQNDAMQAKQLQTIRSKGLPIIPDPNQPDAGKLFKAKISRKGQSIVGCLIQHTKPGSTKNSNFWQVQYHRQVTKRTFDILGYPYYNGGRNYLLGQQVIVENGKTKIRGGLPAGQKLADKTKKATQKSSKKAGYQATSKKIDITLDMLSRCCNVIHKWREMNESPATALEVVLTDELTKVKTGIYDIKPRMAARAMRILGRINRINHNFDLVSCMAVRRYLQGSNDKTLLCLMEKYVADLETLLRQLHKQNDNLSMALGLGPINRRKIACENSKIDFSRDRLPAPGDVVISEDGDVPQ